jgi:hypothetical protein
MKTQINTTIMALLLATVSTTVTAADAHIASNITTPQTTVTAPVVETSTAPTITKKTIVKDVDEKIIASKAVTPKTTEVANPKAKAKTTTTETDKAKVAEVKFKMTAPVKVTVPTKATVAKKLATGYVGFGVGKTNLDLGVTSLTNTTFEENHQGVKIIVGFNVDKHLSIEGHFANLGGGTLSGKNGNTFSLNGTGYNFKVDSDATVLVDASTLNYGISGVYNFINIYDVANTNKITPFVKVGLQKWETKFDSDAINVNTDALETISGSDAFYGVGISAQIADGVRAKLEFERFGMTSDTDYVSLVVVSDY